MAVISRRHFFSNHAVGLGVAALAMLDSPRSTRGSTGHSGDSTQHRSPPHHEVKAKRAIYLFMAEGPSQIDLWDHKPAMSDRFNEPLPDSVRHGQRLTTMTSRQDTFPIAPSIFAFRPHGQSGTMVSELLPHLASKVDEIAVIRSTHTEAINHDPAITYICTGDETPGKPSLGSWLSYGLGTENENLPAFMVMTPRWSSTQGAQSLFHRLWGNGFLPGTHQGVSLRTIGDPVLYLSNPDGIDASLRRRMLDSLRQINEQSHLRMGDPDTLTRITQYELAFRMQTSLPELVNIADEPRHVLDLYGPEVTTPGTFAHCCLLARRMAERGVRFTQIFHRGWDQHFILPKDLSRQCHDIDQPCAGLLTDLRNRGLLDETLVVWGGEFGRTAYCQGKLTPTDYGRDHHPRCFTTWMAGGGVKGGVVHGETDDFSYNVVRDPVHVRDLNATILHQLGIDHEQLTYPYQGLQQRLTGVEPARVVTEILA